VSVKFKEELNKVIPVFDPKPMMSRDDIFPKLSGSKIRSTVLEKKILCYTNGREVEG